VFDAKKDVIQVVNIDLGSANDILVDRRATEESCGMEFSKEAEEVERLETEQATHAAADLQHDTTQYCQPQNTERTVVKDFDLSHSNEMSETRSETNAISWPLRYASNKLANAASRLAQNNPESLTRIPQNTHLNESQAAQLRGRSKGIGGAKKVPYGGTFGFDLQSDGMNEMLDSQRSLNSL